jgi:hypothetical protein
VLLNVDKFNSDFLEFNYRTPRHRPTDNIRIDLNICIFSQLIRGLLNQP